MTTRRFVYSSDEQITAIKAESTYLWIAFAQNSDDICILKKVWASSPNQVFFEIEKEVNSIINMDADSTKLYVAYNDTTLLGEIFTLNTPLSSTTEISIPVGVNESPVDVKIDGTNLFYLIPGDLSGENAKLLRYNTSGVLQETIDLTRTGEEVLNAKAMTIDANGDIWIITYTNPSTVVRVFELSGGGYDWTVTNIV